MSSARRPVALVCHEGMCGRDSKYRVKVGCDSVGRNLVCIRSFVAFVQHWSATKMKRGPSSDKSASDAVQSLFEGEDADAVVFMVKWDDDTQGLACELRDAHIVWSHLQGQTTCKVGECSWRDLQIDLAMEALSLGSLSQQSHKDALGALKTTVDVLMGQVRTLQAAVRRYEDPAKKNDYVTLLEECDSRVSPSRSPPLHQLLPEIAVMSIPLCLCFHPRDLCSDNQYAPPTRAD